MRLFCVIVVFSCLFVLSCDKDADPCDGISCINGGNCVNGDCICPAQWTGTDCSQEKVPIKMRVSRIQITSFPPTNVGGSGWDLFDGPDVYLVISRDIDILFETGFVEDLTTTYEWSLNFEFTDPTATYTISVYDYDDGITDDDFMGGISFTPYMPGGEFPNTITLDCSNCVVSFIMNDVVYFHL